MARLSRYLLKLFSAEALALFGVAALLLFLIQCLRLFDVVSDKGQSLVTLLGQAMLGMPGLGLVFLYVCLGIGLGRTLRNLQGTSELQVIHASGLVGALLRAIGLYALGGAAILLLLAHILDPLSVRTASSWTASIAADLVTRSMIPHKFTDVVPGVSMVIGSRDNRGNITDFFADDHRGETRRTYFARSAIIAQDEEGYVLRLSQGALQYMNADHRFSQISFDRYDLALDRLTGPSEVRDGIGNSTSLDLIATALSSGDPEVIRTLIKRTGEAFRVIALCLFVTALAAFPTGKRRRFEVPIELAVLGAAFVERAVTSYLPGSGWLQLGTGSILLALAALVILAVRLRVFSPARRRVSA